MAGRVSIVTELLGIDTVARGLEKLVENLKEVGKQGEGGGGGKISSITGAIGDMALGFAKGAVSVLTFKKVLEETEHVIEESLERFSEMERLTLRMDAVWKATGGSAGVMTSEVMKLSEEISKNTFVTQEQVIAAATSLATFRSVHGQTFKEILQVSSDVAAAMGRDFQSTVFLIGRAVEGLESGQINGLTRSFRFLSPTIVAAVEQLEKMGDKSGAVKALLDGLRDSTAGAGAGEHAGLAGATDEVKKAWEDFEIQLGEFITKSAPVQQSITAIGAALRTLGHDLQTVNAGTTAESTGANLDELLAKRARLMAAEPGTSSGMSQRTIDERVAALDKEIAVLQFQHDAIVQAGKDAEALAQAKAAAAQQDTKNALMLSHNVDLLETYHAAITKVSDDVKGPVVQAQEAYNKALREQAVLNKVGTSADQSNAAKNVKDAKDALVEAQRAAVLHDRAMAGLNLTIMEHTSDLGQMIDAQEMSGREFAITTQLIQYENEERAKGIGLSNERILQLRAEAEAQVSLNATLDASLAIRNNDQEIKDLRDQITAQNQSNYARRQAVALQQAEAQIRKMNLTGTEPEAKRLRDQAAAQFQLNNALNDAEANQAINRQVASLERQVGAVGMLDEQSRQYILTLQMMNEAEDRDGTLRADQIQQIEDQAAAIAHLEHILDKVTEEHRAQIAGVQQVIGAVQDSATQLGDTLLDALASGQNPAKALLNTFKDLAMQWAKMILQLGVINPLMNQMFSGVEGFQQQPNLGGIFSKILGSILPGLAGAGGGGGGIAPPVRFGGAFASGTDMMVSRPTMFLAGEAGTERVQVTPHGRSSGMSVYIDARGADRMGLLEVRRQLNEMNATMNARIVSTVVDAHRSGGQTSARLRR